MISPAARNALVRRLLRWGRRNRRPFPWRAETDGFKILVAEVLLQRSRGKTVAKVYQNLFNRWTSARELGAAGVPEIANVIRPLGLTGRARHLKALALEIGNLGGIPRTTEELMDLPGVGRYAANATLAAAFNKTHPVVDGVTARVYRRYFDLPDDAQPVNDQELWRVVADVVPKRAAREWNWAVLDLASAICMPKVPRCGECPLEDSCAYSLSRVGGDC